MIWSVFLLAPPLEVLLTTPGTLALHKPAGLATQRRIDTESSLIGQVRRELSNPDAELPHRLDAIAGGIVVVATDRASLRAHNAAIAARLWGPKVYVARCRRPSDSRIASALRGASDARAGTDDPVAAALIGAHRAYLKTSGRRAVCVRSGGKPSFLDVLLAAPCPVDRSVLDLVISIRTGRFHQIRAMMAHAGAPLLHDPLYDEAARPSPSAPPPFLTHALLGLPVPSEGGVRVVRAARLAPPACEPPDATVCELLDRLAADIARAASTATPGVALSLSCDRATGVVSVVEGGRTGTAAPGQAPVYAPLSPT